ncbi:methyl-coenzyme M reductase operon protein D [Methanoregula sp.]|jgi:methyl-coenzyme M reductase subunit D|uniref:methyl-coenzyme M reductase operon protein D n=1 Tax=Methanoregula sp. TaxID=2052170 RepID=UPI0025D4FD75|nr:methyl-coenzyme M reductase operon protein D [Methanoregula sp.]
MTDATFPQCRIVTERLLNPETTEHLLNKLSEIAGIRRMVLNGPRLPATVTYGPATGMANPHNMRKTIHVGDQEVELQVHVGTVILELESRDVIPTLKTACEQVFTNFTFRIQEGKFMKTEPSLVDYCKYGPDADKSILGLADPSSKSKPTIIQGIK